ncbi:heterogeneous nuclear ribonucleoprotein U-like protein 1 [Argiope bruennichi]|uniref:heterogeneous nuclear ribonucleoprotein U-like protein 1 n=1 Tax=Argiope bruennichi TaxID=94029 RepID=UPI002495597E|nr:heterogeneous nuclear ribonucleoprotein U-like protein 1 [Argiope bruennichi]
MKIETEEIDETIITLDTYNSDLNLVIAGSLFSAHPLTDEGFAFMWAGARATHGTSKGKFCFEVKVLDHLDVSHLPADEPNPHVVRVGFSVESSSLQLGEDPLSYGYGGTGKISTNCQFKDFGQSFICGDVILAVCNMDGDQVQLGFAKNGKFLGWAYKINKSELKGKALFPHVLTKNTAFEVNFGQKEKPYFPLPDVVKDYIFIGCLPLEQRESGTRPPKRKADCEMIMMCGLPGAGKSVWAADYSVKHPEKKYNILGTNNIIDKMKVMGLPRKRNYAGRWDVLIQMATKCLNKMFEIGSNLRRNYILDQTNVYPSAQRRKMRNFEGFKRIAVVIVPTDAEYRRRCDKRDREEGKDVPDQAVLEMKANFKLPEVGDVFDDVIYTELQKAEAEKLVAQYNEEGKAAVGPARKQFKPSDQQSGYGNNRGNMTMRGGFSSRGGFDSGRGGFDSNRGGYDNGRGGFRGGRGGFGNNRGSFDNNRGGFDGNKGGFDGNRGGYDWGRGGFNNNRGGRGGYEGGRGGYDAIRGGYEGNRGGHGSFEEGRIGYDGGHGGFEEGRVGYDGGFKGGYEKSRGGFESGRGGYSGSRGGYDGGRGGYNNSRGGYDSKRGLDEGPQRFDRLQGAGDSPGGFGGNTQSNYGGYGESSAGFGNNSRGFGSRGTGRGRGDFGRSSGNQDNFGNRDYGYGGDKSGSYFGSNYGQEPALGAYDKGGPAASRGFRGASRDMPHGAISRGGNASSRGSIRGGYGSSDYDRDSSDNYSSGYGGYQEPYSRRDAPYGSQGVFKKEPVTEAAPVRGTRAGGKATRWSAEITPSFPDRTVQAAGSYSTYEPQIKTEPPASGGVPRYDSFKSNATSSYSTYVTPNQSNQGFQGSSQSYGYQSGATTNTASQQWSGTQPSTGSVQGSQAAPGQQQWSPYYQPSQSSPHYNQYYGQPATGAAPPYGNVYGAK